MADIVFLHGLESTVDEQLIPVGRKARWLADWCATRGLSLGLPALDSRAAASTARASLAATGGWQWPFEGRDEQGPFAERTAAAFVTPLARAEAAIGPDTRLVIGSSFGGAILLELLHRGVWSGPSIFLAGAGAKLTPHRALPPAVRCLLVHGTRDAVVPCQDSHDLAATSARARCLPVDDEHRLAGILSEDQLGRWIGELLDG